MVGFDKYKHRVADLLQDQFNQIMGSTPQKGGWRNFDNFVVVCLVDREHEYTSLKKDITSLGVLSQMLTRRTSQRINLSIASNIMK